MIEASQFADRQLELTGEFGMFAFDHPEIDELLPDGTYVYFEVAGEEEFNRYSRELAECQRTEGVPVVIVRVKGIAPAQGSRLIDPVIEPIVVATGPSRLS